MPLHDSPVSSQREDPVSVPADRTESLPEDADLGPEPRGPTYLGLSRLAPRRQLSRASADLYRHIARLLELDKDSEFVVVPCGRGLPVQFLAKLTGAAGAGVDPDRALIDIAAARAREAGLSERLHYEEGRLDDLPYQDSVFDVAIGEIGLGAAEDVAAAVRELARVTRPMGSVVLIQLTWTGGIDAERRESVVSSLGVRPLLLVECKQLLREAGVVDLHVEDWTDMGGARQPWPLAGLAEIGSVRDRTVMVWRAWRHWGWAGVQLALRSGGGVRELLARERVLGLSVIRGIKWRGEEDH
jgi:SAM-dependent methyltransferase